MGEVLQFKPRPKPQAPVAQVAPAGKPVSPNAIQISEWDCHLMDAVKARADSALDVVNMGANVAESFLHDALRVQSSFKFGQHTYRLVLQLEQTDKPQLA